MEAFDISNTLKANSDQLNADDLVAGPITVKISKVTRGNADQPVLIHLEGGHMPFKPCKTVRRLLAAAWGTDAAVWRGRWMKLYREPGVKFGGKVVGGVRVKAVSHISAPITENLSSTRGQRKMHRLMVLTPADIRQAGGVPTARLSALLEDKGINRQVLEDWHLDAFNKPVPGEGHSDRAELAAYLVSKPQIIAQLVHLSKAGEE